MADPAKYDTVHSLPDRLFLSLPNINCHTDVTNLVWSTQFIPLWNRVRDLVQGPEPRTIDNITEALLQANHIAVNENYEAYQSAKELRNYCSFDDTEDRKLFNATKLINVKDINAHVLGKVCGVKIQWVDSLSCHLELDRQAGTLFLYRYPSFCVASLQGKTQDGNQESKPVIQCCGVDASSPLPWANEADINDLLHEILLSYRVLFGQSRRSRKLFRRLRPFAQTPPELHDSFLSDICTKKEPKCSINLIEREQYDLVGDFPHLRSRLVRLNSYATSKMPRSVRQLWKDKRDSTAWLAFWSVIIIGSIGILLGLIQTVLQIMQYTLTLQQGK
ncbi:unnamed protein product [Clonostachys rosea]|uniref:Uncharacterized protein n=1 Tax=Bionectria ochroleuca TaxID=29856 RepID=A0ABY6UL07_BIOOC|nr:unnamed protein product [Clonostachys rosea]